MPRIIRSMIIFEAAIYYIGIKLYRNHEICIPPEWLANMGPTDPVLFIANNADRTLLSSVKDSNIDEDHIEEHKPQENLLDYMSVKYVQIKRIEVASV